jgi:hypothetical protein
MWLLALRAIGLLSKWRRKPDGEARVAKLPA